MEKTIIQIEITEIELFKRGPADDEEDVNLFKFALSYPCYGIPGLETTKTIKINEEIPSSWGSDFDEAILFKTEIIGKSKLSVEVASVDKDSASDKFFKKLFNSVFGAVLKVWTGGFGSLYVGAITQSIGTSLTDLGDDEDDIDIIGKGAVTVDSSDLLDTTEIMLPLNVKKAVKKKIRQRNPVRGSAQRFIRTDEEVIPVGSNGHVKVKISIL